MLKQKSLKKNLIGYSFVLPSMIGFVLFMAYPLIYSFYISLYDWNMFKPSASEFVGFQNYFDAFKNEYFQASLANNFKFIIMAVPLMLIIAIVVAALLNGKIFGRGALRTMYFMPYVATITASAVVFSALFHPEYGPINGVLRSLGVTNLPGWASSAKWALPMIALFWIWKSVGYAVVIYIAGLQNIPSDCYEAASIDGASKFQQFMNITLPLVSPTTFFLLITSLIGAFQIFPEVQVLTAGGPGTSTFTIVYHIYQSAFTNLEMGYASAVSWVFFVIVLLITILQWIGQKKWVNY